MIRLIDDLVTLTDVSENTFKKFSNLTKYIIGHAVHEHDCENNDITIIDVEIGELHIKVSEGTVKYRFVPSKELDLMICNTVTSGVSPILTKLNNGLQEKIDKAYKELI